MIFMDSPLGCQIAANFFINKGQNIELNIEQNIRQKMKGTKVKYIPYMKSEEKTMNE